MILTRRNDDIEPMTQRYEHMRAMRRMDKQYTKEMELMMGRGLIGWMEAWADYGKQSPHGRVDGHGRVEFSAAPSKGGDVTRQAVGILTAMVWGIVKENVYGN
jgi:hypothetical protein